MGKSEIKYKFRNYSRDTFWFVYSSDVLIFTVSYQSNITPEMTINEIKEQGGMNVCLNGMEV